MKALKKGTKRFLAIVACIVIFAAVTGVAVGVHIWRKKNSENGTASGDAPSLVVLMQDSRVYYKTEEHLAAGKKFYIEVGYEDENGILKEFSAEEVEQTVKFEPSEDFLEVKGDGEMVVKEDKFTDPALSTKAYPVNIKISSPSNSYKPAETTVNVVPCPAGQIKLEGNGQTLEKEIVDVWEGEKLSEGGFPEVPRIENYTFVGWYRVENGAVGSTPIDLDTRYYFGDEITLRARWLSDEPIRLSADGLGQDVELGEQYYNEDLPVLPSLEATDGWTFAGWYTDIGGAGDLVESGKPYAKSNMQLYAKWTGSVVLNPILPTKQEVPSSISVTYHAIPAFPSDPEYGNEGQFVGWYTANGDAGSLVAKDELFASKDISALTLFAKVQFPITFDWKGATPEAATQDAYYAVYNDSMQNLRYFLPKPADKTENGWNWMGWFVEEDDELTDFSETTQYRTAAPLHLVCTRTSQFTLHDELNSEGVATNATKIIQVSYGETLPLDGLSKLEATSWNFEGYNTARGGGGTALYEVRGNILESKNGYTGEGGLHLYAKWTTTLQLNYTLESTTINHSQKEIGVTYYSNPNLPVLTYSNSGKFGGWYTEYAGGGEKIDPAAPYIGEGMDVLYDAIRFTITRDFQDDVLNAQEETEIGIYYGQEIVSQSVFPDYKTKQGWEFDGWHSLSTPNGTLIQYDKYDIAYDLKVYAWWKSTVHFYQELDTDGSHRTDSFTQATVHYNQPFSAPDGPDIVLTAQGWEFGGFYTEVGGAGIQMYTEKGIPAQDLYLEKGGIPLYAKWVSHSIKLNNHGFKTTETIPVTFTVVYHAIPQNLPKPVYVTYATVPDKQDGQFEGWYTSADYNDGDCVSADVPYTGAPDSTFYAKIVFKVILDYMGAEIKDSNPTKWVDTLEAVYGRTYRQSNKEDFDLPNPTKGGWTFSGWCVKGYNIDGQAISVSPDMRYDLDFAATLYARWTTQFKLMREISESGRIDDDSYSFLTVEYKKDVTLPALEADGWAFAGWYEMTGGQGDGYDSEHLTLGAYEGKTGRTLYAKWKMTLTSENLEVFLDTASGTNLTKEVVYKGEIGELPSPMYQNSGATFLGWNFDAHMEGRDVGETSIFHYPTDIKFYAKVGLKLKIVKEDVTNQEIEEEYQVIYNAKIGINGKLPTLENTSAWDFAGYYTGRYGEGEQITNSTIFADRQNKTIYAKWEAEITLSYVITEYSKGETISVVYGGPLELPHDASIGAWHLSGWYTNGGYRGDNLLADADLKLSNTEFGRTTLYAQWKADISLNSRDGENSSGITILTGVIYNISLSGQEMRLPRTDEMTRTDYVFDGWYADLHEAEAFDETSAIVNGKTSEVTDTTSEYPLNIQMLYAKWAPGSAYVELDPNNNGGIVTKIQVYVGQPMPEVDAPKPQTASGSEPLTFVGYFFHPNGKDDPTGAIQYYAPAGDMARSVHLWDMGTRSSDVPIRLYAHWENMLVVTWMLDDEETILETDNVEKPGGAIRTQHPVYDKTLPEKESTPQYNYEFIGWKVKGDFAHENDNFMLKEADPSDGKYTYSDYNITCSIRLIAVFEPKIRSYTVTWLNDDGSQLREDTVEYGKQPTYSETPTKDQTPQYSYTFAGWKGADGTLYDGALEPVTGDVTYRAQYNSKIRSYTVTWEDWNHEQLYQLTLDYGTDPKEKYKGPEPTREKTAQYEYTFSRWSPEFTAVTGDVTYTAQYNSITRVYKVTWKVEGKDPDVRDVQYGDHPTHENAVRASQGYLTYEFLGWSTESFEGPVVDLNSITIERDTTFYATFKTVDNTPPPAGDSGDGGGKKCLVAGTLITLADGSKVPVETLTGNEMIRVWDFENGCIAERPILFVAHEAENTHPIVVRVLHLTFSDGTYIEIVGQEGFWNVDRNMAVYINEGNYSEYIGETFNKQTGNGWLHVQLVAVDLIVRYTNYWSPISTEHMGFFANDLLVFPGLTKIFNNILEVDPDTMKYDEAKMQADIEKYGLYTCEEFLAQFPIPESFFKAFDVKYLKIAFGKGLIAWDDIIKLVEENGKYLLFG